MKKSPLAQDVIATSAAFVGDRAIVFSALSDGQVAFWMKTGRQVETALCECQSPRLHLRETKSVCIDEYSAKSDLSTSVVCCSGTRSGMCELWEYNKYGGTLKPMCRWRAHEPSPGPRANFEGTSAVAMHGACIVSGGSTGTAALWTARTSQSGSPELNRKMDDAHRAAISAACQKSVGTQNISLTGGEDGVVKAWSPCGDCELPRHDKDVERAPGVVNQLCLDILNNRCCASHADGFVRAWDLASGCGTVRLSHKVGNVLGSAPMDQQGVHAVSFDTESGNPSRIATGCLDGSLCIWDVRAGFCRSPICHVAAHSKAVSSVAFCGELLLAVSLDGNASLWDLRKQPLAMLGQMPLITQYEPSRPCGGMTGQSLPRQANLPYVSGGNRLPGTEQSTLKPEAAGGTEQSTLNPLSCLTGRADGGGPIERRSLYDYLAKDANGEPRVSCTGVGALKPTRMCGAFFASDVQKQVADDKDIAAPEVNDREIAAPQVRSPVKPQIGKFLATVGVKDDNPEQLEIGVKDDNPERLETSI